jgi:hypothetical protein
LVYCFIHYLFVYHFLIQICLGHDWWPAVQGPDMIYIPQSECIVSLRLYRYGDQEKLKKEGEGCYLNFLGGLAPKEKFMSLLKFFLLFRYLFEVMFKVKVNLEFYKLFFA